MGSQNMRWRIVRVSHKEPSRDDPTTGTPRSVLYSKEPVLENLRLCQIAPLEDLRHVKRVRKTMVEGKIELSVILCTVIDCENRKDMPSGVLEIVSANRLSPYLTNVPKFAASSREEWEEQCKLWPTSYHPQTQIIDGITEFSEDDSQLIFNHMNIVIGLTKMRCLSNQVVNAAIIMDPAMKQIIASGTDQTCSLLADGKQSSWELAHCGRQEEISFETNSAEGWNSDLLPEGSCSESTENTSSYNLVSCLNPWSWMEQKAHAQNSIMVDNGSTTMWHPLRHATLVAIENAASRDRRLYPVEQMQTSSTRVPTKRQKTQNSDNEEEHIPEAVTNSLTPEATRPYLCTGYDIYIAWEPCTIASRGLIYSQAGRESWDFSRFLKTLYFFNGPPSPSKFVDFLIAKLSSQTSGEPANIMENSGIVLVTGATGGVGRRVVDVLRKKGYPVRVLVRNEEKARKMLGPDIDMVIGDVTKESTLNPGYFKGVRKVINVISVIVGPKEGDTPDRAKYSQGIKFFEPEIKGDSPEMVEYIGMKNLINALKNSVGNRDGKLLFGFEGPLPEKLVWGALDDVVMGGVSESTFQINPTGNEYGGPVGLFKGVVSTANNGGFTSIRTRNLSVPEDLSAYDGLQLRLKGDGRHYKLIVRTSAEWDTVGYTASFDTVEGQWQTISIPFSSLRPIFRAKTVLDAPPFDGSKIISLQLMYSKFEYDGKLNPTFTEGAFELPFSSIRAYIQEPITPRFVHVGSAGVTRPDRPGLDLSKQPPAVRLNKELDFILTFKLKGEDLIRESGIPYTIVRPCALTEEPAGADLIFDQGDNITGKISREEVARICVATLESPYALDKTFEVKSVVPFSEPYTVDPSNPPPEKDYDTYFKTLKDGITGKEALEEKPVPV
ncbi:hypothetical protein QJS10_CPB20g01701 [Acorus calamus]|uniref:NAD(P)-binding Rossmann-fold superfamily protein n=1 Tax=Acorus calamus TaxID=4465 RepID=A0AAV9CBP1_ACOCL|nr:hypothetical protein QJS10_CPB20g01701 [Acorus calamus]